MKTKQNRYIISFVIILLAVGLLLYPNQNHKELIKQFITPTPTQQESKNTTVSPSSIPTITNSVSSDNVAGPGQGCGGFVMNAKHCAPGYVCKLNRTPDTGGICVPK